MNRNAETPRNQKHRSQPRTQSLLFIASVLGILGLATTARAEPSLPAFLAPDTLAGELWAAECLMTPEPVGDCHLAALRSGKPGGLLHGQKYTVLLVDGRVLSGTCAARPVAVRRLRAHGIIHANGGAMTVFALEQDCGTGWNVVYLPYSGVSAIGAEGGDE